MAVRKLYNFLVPEFLNMDIIRYYSVNEEWTLDLKDFDFWDLISDHCSADEVKFLPIYILVFRIQYFYNDICGEILSASVLRYLLEGI